MTNRKTIEELINQVRDNNLKELDLSILAEIPPEIPDELYDLSSLEKLDLGNIPVKRISKKIKRLNKLKHFRVGSGDFETFPMELLEMQSLDHILITSENLSRLPFELNEWKTLSYLNLDGCINLNKIEGLPPNLGYLNISKTRLQNLPSLIYTLGKLNKIVIHNLGLTKLPNRLFELTTLQSLFAGKNMLSTIPTRITDLKELRELMIYENNFEEFPMAIIELKKLQRLDINRNRLKSIPNEIVSLQNLYSLNLGENELEEVPEPIQELKNLKYLVLGNISNWKLENHLPYNKITTLPEWITKLPYLESLEISKLFIKNVPEEILREGVEAIKNYFLSRIQADEEVFLYEAKMVVVGRGSVGKSVLTKKLTIPGYTLADSATTKGINILKNPFLFQTNELEKTSHFKFSIWDFGGQEKYDATHQLFITDRSLYLFLTEAREESNYSDFQFWLNTIALFSNNSPVIVVLSKCDERRKLLPESIYRQKFKNIVDFVDVSCADDYEYTLDNLKNAIRKAINLLPQTHQKLSNHWVEIRQKLENLSSTQDYISYNKYLSICNDHKLNPRQADFLSQFLNDLGVIIHHQHDLLLKKTVFINTDWCVDGMYKVLDDNTVFNRNGKFTIKDLQNIWSEERFSQKQEELLKLLKEYHLCFELKDGSGFIAPDLLPPDKILNLTWDADSSNLKFEFRYAFMPAGLLTRFIVKCHSFIKDNLYWKYGVVLENESTIALVEEDYINNKIRIAIQGDNKKGLLSAIRMFINEVHRDFDHANKLVFEEMVPCNCNECSENSTPHFYKFDVLKKFTKKGVDFTTCEKSVEQVKINSLINDIQIKNPTNFLETDDDLKNYILDLIDHALVRDITLKEGYINFWRDSQCKQPKNEIEIQPYISNTLDNFCKVRGINLSREVREGNGSVDIMFSCTNRDGNILKTCLEIKKAHHQHVTTSIKSQLPTYLASSETKSGIYLVIWYKHRDFLRPAEFSEISKLLPVIEKNNPDKNNISIRIVECTKPISPSKKR